MNMIRNTLIIAACGTTLLGCSTMSMVAACMPTSTTYGQEVGGMRTKTQTYDTDRCNRARDKIYSTDEVESIAANGSARVRYNLARAYEYGNSNFDPYYRPYSHDLNHDNYEVKKNRRRAVHWYKIAAKQGNRSARDALVRLDIKFPASVTIAVQQADNRSAVAALKRNDDKEAFRLWALTAKEGNADAQTSLGYLYLKGRGVDKDSAAAVLWTRKAAAAGSATGQANLGVMYANGDGVSKNTQTAIGWYRKAAAQGHEGARKSLAKLGATP